jgi:hypothetical protein
MKAMEF